MFISACFDLPDGALGRGAQEDFRRRLIAAEAAGLDYAILGRELDGTVAPGRIEALVAMPWVASELKRSVIVGVVPAVHSTPFHVARALSAIDFLSDGRSGWMTGTGDRAAYDAAYGPDLLVDAGQVRDKSEDFVRAVEALWDSWDDDALVIDKQAGVYLDSAKVRRVDYRGSHFATMGALNAARPPQGYPVLFCDLDDPAAPLGASPDVVLIRAPSAAEARARVDEAGFASAPALVVKSEPAEIESAIAIAAQLGAIGVHLLGQPDAETVAAIRATLPASPAAKAGTARQRIGAKVPSNPFQNVRVA